MRRFLAAVPALLLAACQLNPVADHVKDMPLVDVHGHVQEAMSAEALVRIMDQAGVSRMILQATYGGPRGTDEQSLRYAEQYPGRFVPFIGFQSRPALYEHWSHGATTPGAAVFLDSVEAKLKTGRFFGMGEIVLRYHGHQEPGADCCPEVERSVESPLMRRVADLAVRYQVPMLIHAEGEPAVVAGMQALFKSRPDAVIVWAHNCGRQSAAAIESLLGQHSNLYCDLGGMTYTRPFGYGTYWPRSTPWTFLIENGSGRLLDEMRALFERFPDRFMVGMDVYFYGSYQFFAERAYRFRQLLSQLSAPTARKLAHQNAERVLRISRTP